MRTDLYAIHITLRNGYAGGGKHGWSARLHWQDSRFCEDGAVEGDIHTRYREETPAAAIDAVMEAAETFGLRTIDQAESRGTLRFSLYYEGDGENRDFPPPDGWRETLKAEADRRGWGTYGSVLRHSEEHIVAQFAKAAEACRLPEAPEGEV